MIFRITARIRSGLRRFSSSADGSIGVVLGLMAVPLVLALGMSVDLMSVHTNRNRLQAAVDAAALAVGANSPNATSVTAQMQTLANSYMAADFGANTPVITISGQDVTVTATASVPTTFLQIVGTTSFTISATSTAKRYLSGIEVMMVLDNTGSLGLSNINTLKVASYNLLKTLFGTDASGNVNTTSTTVRVGMVPYVASVNAVPAISTDISASAQSAIATKLIGSSYGTNTSPNPLALGQGDATKWWGCAIENHASTFAAVSSASSTYSTYNYSSLNVANLETALNTYSTNGTATQYIRVPNTLTTVSKVTTCKVAASWPFTNNGGAAGTVLLDGTCANKYTWAPSTTTGVPASMSAWYAGNDDSSNGGQGSDYGPNQSCPATPVVPLTGNSAQLVAEVGVTVKNGTVTANDGAGLLDWHQGGTAGSLGLAWAYRALQPTSNNGIYAGVSTSSEWNTPAWQKVLVLMTDGANNIYQSQYTGYGPYSSTYGNYNASGSTTYGSNIFSGVGYNKMIEMQEMAVCDALKSHGVTIYTLFFNDGSSPGPAIGYCSGPSTTTGHPAKVNGATFDYSPYTLYASNATQLTDAFTKIGNQLSKLRLTQ